MRKNQWLLRVLSSLIAVAVMLHATACGTILYPERRGQTTGRIDIGVVLLNSVGLLFFLVPGVVAFAVDFATGAIFLPPGFSQRPLTPSDLQNARVIQIEPTSLTRSKIESVVERQIGQRIELTSPETRVARVVSEGDLVWGCMAEALTPCQLAMFERN